MHNFKGVNPLSLAVSTDYLDQVVNGNVALIGGLGPLPLVHRMWLHRPMYRDREGNITITHTIASAVGLEYQLNVV